MSYLLKFPQIVWITITGFHSMDLNNFIAELTKLANTNRKVALDYAFGTLKFDWDIRSRKWIDLPIFYIFFKVLSIGIILLDLAIIQFVFGTSNEIFGFQLIHNLLYKISWRETATFPRIVQCIIWRNEEASAVPNLVTCVLSLNAIYEKTILLIWIWLVILLILSIISLVYWSCKLFIPFVRQIMINNILETMSPDELCKRKLNGFLNRERCFVFSLISLNIDHVFHVEISWRFLADDSSIL